MVSERVAIVVVAYITAMVIGGTAAYALHTFGLRGLAVAATMAAAGAALAGLLVTAHGMRRKPPASTIPRERQPWCWHCGAQQQL